MMQHLSKCLEQEPTQNFDSMAVGFYLSSREILCQSSGQTLPGSIHAASSISLSDHAKLSVSLFEGGSISLSVSLLPALQPMDGILVRTRSIPLRGVVDDMTILRHISLQEVEELVQD